MSKLPTAPAVTTTGTTVPRRRDVDRRAFVADFYGPPRIRARPDGAGGHWIDVAAPLPGFAGFAVGRSIWEAALQDMIAGRIERTHAVSVIADRYRRPIDSYCTARQPGSGGVHPPEPFTLQNPRLTPDREDRIRRSLKGADLRGTKLPA